MCDQRRINSCLFYGNQYFRHVPPLLFQFQYRRCCEILFICLGFFVWKDVWTDRGEHEWNRNSERWWEIARENWNPTTCHSPFLIFILCFRSTIYSNLCTHLHVHIGICKRDVHTYHMNTVCSCVRDTEKERNGEKNGIDQDSKVACNKLGKKGIFNTHTLTYIWKWMCRGSGTQEKWNHASLIQLVPCIHTHRERMPSYPTDSHLTPFVAFSVSSSASSRNAFFLSPFFTPHYSLTLIFGTMHANTHTHTHIRLIWFHKIDAGRDKRMTIAWFSR